VDLAEVPPDELKLPGVSNPHGRQHHNPAAADIPAAGGVIPQVVEDTLAAEAG